MEYLGLLAISLVPLEINLNIAGVEGWDVNDLFLPIIAFILLCKRLGQRKLANLYSGISLLPLIFLLIAILHIFTDPRLDKIIKEVSSYKIPTGGFRLYYTIFINTVIYYSCPLILDNLKKINYFKLLFIIGILIQIATCFLRISFGIEELPWDTYSSRLHSLESEATGTVRLILLGNMGFLLFGYSLIVLEQNKYLRLILLLISCVSLYYAGGRAMLYGSIIVFILYVYFLKKKKLFCIIAGILLIIQLAIFAINPQLANNLPPLLKKYVTILSTDSDTFREENSRMAMWKTEVKLLSRNYLWGSLDNIPYYIGGSATENIIRGSSHNVYLGIASRFGLPALFVWLLFICQQLRKINYCIHKYFSELKWLLLCRWILFSSLAYLAMNFGIGGAEGGHRSWILLLSLMDVMKNIEPQINNT